ncbi:acylphosphatase [Aerosakkonema sp. BLCC-F183]|uniref:acylphosphatase n=1 Tax=Aerosakkonema sp. BLCC-F183 TaxID=3342834 RepID=UPI0035B99200
MPEQSPHQNKVRAHVFVSGIVQGVGYRYSTLKQAQRVGVGGWVRNVPDGRVEAVFEGTKADVEAMIRWCYRGSPSAEVTDVAVEYEQPQGIESFAIERRG